MMSFRRALQPTPSQSQVTLASSIYSHSGESMFDEDMPPVPQIPPTYTQRKASSVYSHTGESMFDENLTTVPQIPLTYTQPYVEDDTCDDDENETYDDQVQSPLPKPVDRQDWPLTSASHYPTAGLRQKDYDLALARLEGQYVKPDSPPHYVPEHPDEMPRGQEAQAWFRQGVREAINTRRFSVETAARKAGREEREFEEWLLEQDGEEESGREREDEREEERAYERRYEQWARQQARQDQRQQRRQEMPSTRPRNPTGAYVPAFNRVTSSYIPASERGSAWEESYDRSLAPPASEPKPSFDSEEQYDRYRQERHHERRKLAHQSRGLSVPTWFHPTRGSKLKAFVKRAMKVLLPPSSPPPRLRHERRRLRPAERNLRKSQISAPDPGREAQRTFQRTQEGRKVDHLSIHEAQKRFLGRPDLNPLFAAMPTVLDTEAQEKGKAKRGILKGTKAVVGGNPYNRGRRSGLDDSRERFWQAEGEFDTSPSLDPNRSRPSFVSMSDTEDDDNNTQHASAQSVAPYQRPPTLPPVVPFTPARFSAIQTGTFPSDTHLYTQPVCRGYDLPMFSDKYRTALADRNPGPEDLAVEEEVRVVSEQVAMMMREEKLRVARGRNASRWA